jgi:hypothetical protein
MKFAINTQGVISQVMTHGSFCRFTVNDNYLMIEELFNGYVEGVPFAGKIGNLSPSAIFDLCSFTVNPSDIENNKKWLIGPLRWIMKQRNKKRHEIIIPPLGSIITESGDVNMFGTFSETIFNELNNNLLAMSKDDTVLHDVAITVSISRTPARDKQPNFTLNILEDKHEH